MYRFTLIPVYIYTFWLYLKLTMGTGTFYCLSTDLIIPIVVEIYLNYPSTNIPIITYGYICLLSVDR